MIDDFDEYGEDLDFFVNFQSSPCGYFKDRTNDCVFLSRDTSDSDVISNDVNNPNAKFKTPEELKAMYFSKVDYFFSHGFRRCKDFFYANVCRTCSRCIPIRVLVKDFIMNQRFRRILKKNNDIRIEIKDSEITDEKIELFQKYNELRHGNTYDCTNHLLSIHTGYIGTKEMDYFIDDKLVAVGILDMAKTSVSSNYFYFDPDYSDRSLGVLSTLKEIEFAKQNDKPFYYLGFYIEESDKMRYKSEFQPAQVRIKDKWVDFDKTKLTIYKSSNKGK